MSSSNWIRLHGVVTIADISLTPNRVTLTLLVKAFVGQADIQRFEPHLGHNWLSCGVFLVNPGTVGSIRPLAISLSG